MEAAGLNSGMRNVFNFLGRKMDLLNRVMHWISFTFLTISWYAWLLIHYPNANLQILSALHRDGHVKWTKSIKIIQRSFSCQGQNTWWRYFLYSNQYFSISGGHMVPILLTFALLALISYQLFVALSLLQKKSLVISFY